MRHRWGCSGCGSAGVAVGAGPSRTQFVVQALDSLCVVALAPLANCGLMTVSRELALAKAKLLAAAAAELRRTL